MQVLSQKTYRKHIDVMEQYRLMNLKKTLLNYGIKAFNISDLNLAKGTPIFCCIIKILNVLGLLQFILSKVEIRHAMMDASRLIDAYHHLNLKDALVMRTRFLLKARLVHHAMSLIENGREDTESDSVAPIALKKANQISICQEIIIWILDVLETRHPLCQVSSGTAEEYLHYMKSVYEFSKLHTSLGANSDVFGLESVDFDNMYILAKDFDIAILPSDYTSSDNRMRLLERFLESNEEVDSAQAWKYELKYPLIDLKLTHVEKIGFAIENY